MKPSFLSFSLYTVYRYSLVKKKKGRKKTAVGGKLFNLQSNVEPC